MGPAITPVEQTESVKKALHFTGGARKIDLNKSSLLSPWRLQGIMGPSRNSEEGVARHIAQTVVDSHKQYEKLSATQQKYDSNSPMTLPPKTELRTKIASEVAWLEYTPFGKTLKMNPEFLTILNVLRFLNTLKVENFGHRICIARSQH